VKFGVVEIWKVYDVAPGTLAQSNKGRVPGGVLPLAGKFMVGAGNFDGVGVTVGVLLGVKVRVGVFVGVHV
jgi:hypothetical protein